MGPRIIREGMPAAPAGRGLKPEQRRRRVVGKALALSRFYNPHREPVP